jgi:hypothetical protein
MADRAAHLVDRVLRPELRWRQWVFTFPAELAVGLCFHADLAAAVLRVCMRVLFEWQRARSSVQTAVRLHPAAVVQVQRHSDGAGCWYHLHVLAADGVFYEPQGTLEVPFETQPPPGEADVAQLAERIAARVLGLLRRRGPQAEAAEQTLLRRCASAAAQKVRSGTPVPSRAGRIRLHAKHDGFSVHAGVSIAPNRPADLERLCRYLARPPVPESRLSRLDDGRVVLSLKRPRRGVRQFVFEPVAFLARIASLVPPPGWSMVRFWGALAPASPVRFAAVPQPPDAVDTKYPVAPRRPKRMRWRDLLQRVFLVDATRCPCGGTLRTIRLVTDPEVGEAILAALILSKQHPARAPPRP